MIIHREKRRNPSKDDGDCEQQQLDWARQDGAVVVLLHRKTRIFLELTWPVGSDSCPGLRQSPDHSAVSKELTQAAISRHKSPIPPPSGLKINLTAAAMRQRKVCDLFATPLQKKIHAAQFHRAAALPRCFNIFGEMNNNIIIFFK